MSGQTHAAPSASKNKQKRLDSRTHSVHSLNMKMTATQNTTAQFLTVIDAKTKVEILNNIAQHYGITADQAFAEVTDSEAEHLLDYVTGSARLATSALMQRHGLK